MRTLALYHLKGGVGKTAAAVNIAHAAAADGVPTLFWDLDPQAAGSWYLQAKPRKAMDAKRLVKGKLAVGRLVRETAYDNLAIMPADFSLRSMDILLRKLDDPQQVLKRLIAPFGESFSLVVLDCPPTISQLAENIFVASDAIAVPVVPTHLSVRALEQVRAHYKALDGKQKRLHPFYSMVDRRRTLHRSLLDEPPPALKNLLPAAVPYAAVVEKMGDYRAPLAAFAPTHPATLAYQQLWRALRERMGRI